MYITIYKTYLIFIFSIIASPVYMALTARVLFSSKYYTHSKNKLGQHYYNVLVFIVPHSHQVVWEILPAVEPMLPPFIDLLFFGDPGADVAPAAPRNQTGTTAFQFSGQVGSVITVSRSYQPSDTGSGFTMRCSYIFIHAFNNGTYRTRIHS